MGELKRRRRRRPKFLIWYGVWAGIETNVFRLVKTKKTARLLAHDLRTEHWCEKSGFKRLIETPAKKRKRRKKKSRPPSP